MPDLSKLSLDDVIQLRAMMMTLVEAGKTIGLECRGVTFDLTPGQPVRIITPFQMPGFAAHEKLDFKLDGMIEQNAFVIEGLDENLDAYHRRKIAERFDAVSAASELSKNDPTPAVPDADGAAVEPAPAVALTAAGADDETADAFAKACSDEDPDLEPVALPPAAVVEPTPAARATAAGEGAQPAPWTAEEDDRLVALVAEGVAEGKSFGAAAFAAADILGRPKEGTKFRVLTKVKARVVDAAARLKKVTEEQSGADPAREWAGEDVEDRAEDAWQRISTATDPASVWLGMIKRDGWTLQEDRDLLHFAENGWGVPEIAMELQKESRAIKKRFEDLTKGRTIPRADVLAALEAVLGDRVA